MSRGVAYGSRPRGAVDDTSRGERWQRRWERKAGGGGERATAVLDGYNTMLSRAESGVKGDS